MQRFNKQMIVLSFASCGNKAQQAPVDTDSIAEVVDSVVDSMAVDTVAADSVK